MENYSESSHVPEFSITLIQIILTEIKFQMQICGIVISNISYDKAMYIYMNALWLYIYIYML